MKNYKILYKLTTRSRPEKAIEVINNIHIYQSTRSKHHIHVTLDSDDKTCNNSNFIDALKKYTNLSFNFANSKNKIDAINRDFDLIDFEWDIVIAMSDDMFFHENDFDNEIRRAFVANFNDLDGCVHFPDGNQNEKIITLPILGRKYYERFNYIYNPEYISLWCDVEMTDQAKLLGKYAYINKSIFKHRHPAFGLAEMDEQYKHTESFFFADEQTYKKRKNEIFTKQ